MSAWAKSKLDLLYEALGAAATHSALTTGVHGVGAGTVAKVSDIHAPVTLSAEVDAGFILNTQQIDYDAWDANKLLGGPATGAAAKPTVRTLVSDDIPALAESKITNLTTDLAKIKCCWAGGTFGSLSTSATEYIGPIGRAAISSTDTTATVTRGLVPFAGVVKNLYVVISVAPGGTATRTFTLRKNGSDQAVTCTVPAGGTTASDTTHSFTVVAGDALTITSTLTETPAACVVTWGFEIDPT